MLGGGVLDKVPTPVAFPHELDLSPYGSASRRDGAAGEGDDNGGSDGGASGGDDEVADGDAASPPSAVYDLMATSNHSGTLGARRAGLFYTPVQSRLPGR